MRIKKTVLDHIVDVIAAEGDVPTYVDLSYVEVDGTQEVIMKAYDADGETLLFSWLFVEDRDTLAIFDSHLEG